MSILTTLNDVLTGRRADAASTYIAILQRESDGTAQPGDPEALAVCLSELGLTARNAAEDLAVIRRAAVLERDLFTPEEREQLHAEGSAVAKRGIQLMRDEIPRLAATANHPAVESAYRCLSQGGNAELSTLRADFQRTADELASRDQRGREAHNELRQLKLENPRLFPTQ